MTPVAKIPSQEQLIFFLTQHRNRCLGSFIALTLLVVLAFYATSFAFLDPDCFVIGESAQSVLDGKVLYKSACWDNKPPLGILFYAVPQLVIPRSYAAVQVFLGIWVLLQAAVFLLFLRREQTVPVLSGAALLALLPFAHRHFTWASSEDWTNMFSLVVLLSAYKIESTRRLSSGICFLAGCAACLGIHCRQTCVLFLAVPLLAILCSGQSPRNMVRALGFTTVGGAAGFGLVAMLVLAVGDWNGYVDALVMAPRRYSEQSVKSMLEVGYFFAATGRTSAVVFLLFTVAGLAVFTRYRRFAAALVMVSLLVVLAPSKPYYHYLSQTFPAIGILTFVALSNDQLWRERGKRVVGSSLVLFFVLNAVFSAVSLPVGSAAVVKRSLDEVAGRVSSVTSEDDTMFVVGEGSAYIYFATSVNAANPIFWDLFFGRLARVLPKDIDEVIEEYAKTPPSVLVIDQERYELAMAEDRTTGDVEVKPHVSRLLEILLDDVGYYEVCRVNTWIILRRQHSP